MVVRARWGTPALILAGLVLLGAAAPASASTGGAPDTEVPGSESPRPTPDRIEVTPNWRDLPGRPKIEDLLDVAAQLGLVCCVAAVIIGGAALGIGRITGSAPSGIRGSSMVLGGAAGALLIIYAPDLVSWMTA